MSKSQSARKKSLEADRVKSDEEATKSTRVTLPEMTADERVVYERAVAQNGQAWAERHVHLILDQARAMGNL